MRSPLLEREIVQFNIRSEFKSNPIRSLPIFKSSPARILFKYQLYSIGPEMLSWRSNWSQFNWIGFISIELQFGLAFPAFLEKKKLEQGAGSARAGQNSESSRPSTILNGWLSLSIWNLDHVELLNEPIVPLNIWWSDSCGPIWPETDKRAPAIARFARVKELRRRRRSWR